MWYRKSNLKIIDEIANKASAMQPYDAMEHVNLIGSYQPPIEIPDDATIDDRIRLLHENTGLYRLYNEIHPQIYLYPRISSGFWWYLLFDPKDLKRIENPDFNRKLETPISVNEPVEVAMEWAHEKYPTALIDYIPTEEEMLAQE